MPKFKVTYANTVIMQRVVEAPHEDAALDTFLRTTDGVDRELRKCCFQLEHVSEVQDAEFIWEVEEV